jgi:hypothetical protein
VRCGRKQKPRLAAGLCNRSAWCLAVLVLLAALLLAALAGLLLLLLLATLLAATLLLTALLTTLLLLLLILVLIVLVHGRLQLARPDGRLRNERRIASLCSVGVRDMDLGFCGGW